MNNENEVNYIEEDNEEIVEVIYKFSIFRKIIVTGVQIIFITMAILSFLYVYRYDPLKKAILVGLIITLDFLLSVILLDERYLKRIEVIKEDFQDSSSEELENKSIFIEDKINEKNISYDNIEEGNISNNTVEIIDEAQDDNISVDSVEIVNEAEQWNIPNDNVDIINKLEEGITLNENVGIVNELEENIIPNNNIEIVEKKEVNIVKVITEELWENPRLLFYSGREIEQINIDKDVYVLGRLRGAVDYVIENLAVGRIHARIIKKDNEYYLEDFNSKNGTFLNGEKLLENELYILKNSDEITLANMKMYFRI